MKKNIFKLTILSITMLNLINYANANHIIKIDQGITQNSLKIIDNGQNSGNDQIEVRYEEINHTKTGETDLNFSPSITNQISDFTQSYITREQYTKERLKYVKNKATGIEILEKTDIINYTNDIAKTRLVNVALVSTSPIVNECTTWLPAENTVPFDQEFTQTRNCNDSVNKVYDYFVDSLKIDTKTIKETINNVVESKQATGSYLNLQTVLSYTGKDASIKRTEGASCSNTLSGDTRRWYRASGDSCKGILTDIATGQNITYNLDPSKTTVIEIEGYTSTSYYSYLTTSFFGGLYITRDGTDFFGSACSNWWTSNCSLAATQPRVAVSGFTTPKTYKFIYSNGKLSYYIEGVLIKKIPFTTPGGVGYFYIGSNSASTYVSRVAVYEHQE